MNDKKIAIIYVFLSKILYKNMTIFLNFFGSILNSHKKIKFDKIS